MAVDEAVTVIEAVDVILEDCVMVGVIDDENDGVCDSLDEPLVVGDTVLLGVTVGLQVVERLGVCDCDCVWLGVSVIDSDWLGVNVNEGDCEAVWLCDTL